MEKQFDATPSRLARAAREGDVARSNELTGVCAFAAALAACGIAAVRIAAGASAALASAAQGRPSLAAIVQIGVWTLLPIAAAALAAIAANAAQSSGIRFSAVKFDASRLAPGANIQRVFSRESVVTVLRASVAFVCAAVCVASVRAVRGDSLAGVAWSAAMRTAWTVAAIGALFGGADLALQTAARTKRLRMSYDEFRRDRKEHDGDPLTRARRKAAHRGMMRASVSRVREAAFVVTNPTHIAMALEYKPPAVAVPRVLVRAADDAAAAVRALAREYDIPLIENVELARALYARTQPGDLIPHDTYLAVAEIVAALARNGALE